MTKGDTVKFPAEIWIFLLYSEQIGRRGPTAYQWVLVALRAEAKRSCCDAAHTLSSSAGMNNAVAVPVLPHMSI